MKYYLCKYIPPRDDFLATMSADEKAWMAGHGAFLDDLLEQSVIVAHGPVMDPAEGDHITPVGYIGVWPVGIYTMKYKAVVDLHKSVQIGVPNDPSNEGRALRVL